MKCQGRHTRNNVAEESYSCPNCNSSNETDDSCDVVFLLQSGESANRKCRCLHENDLLECSACGFVFNGVRMANYMKKNGKSKEVEPIAPKDNSDE